MVGGNNMQLFQHHDGSIRIVSCDLEYTDTIPNFITDLGKEYSELPEGFITRIYQPEIKHYLSTGDTAIPQDLQWEDGDFYIGQISELINRQSARQGIE
jgi:hypothetical protein